MRDTLLGLDIGGTKTELCLVRLPAGSPASDYTVLGSQRLSTEPHSGLESFLKRVSSQIDRLLLDHGLGRDRIRAIGIGVPGALHPRSGVLSQSSIPFLSGLALKTVFEGALTGMGPAVLENDANCFALAEARLGAGAGWAVQNGIRQEDLYFARTSGKERLPAREIFRRLEEGNPFALATVESYREDLTTFLSNVSNIFDPHVIVLGGGMSTQDRIYSGLEERLKETCFLTENPPSILKHKIGDSAGMIGAALLAHETEEA